MKKLLILLSIVLLCGCEKSKIEWTAYSADKSCYAYATPDKEAIVIRCDGKFKMVISFVEKIDATD